MHIEESKGSLRILILTTAYGPGRPHAPLVETLSDIFAADGYDVRVAGVNWDATPDAPALHYYETNGVEVLMASPRTYGHLGRVGGLLGKWLKSSPAAVRDVKEIFGDGGYDLVFVMTPGLALWSLILWALARTRFSYAYVTDFFPIQHANIGLFPSPILKGLAWVFETLLLRRFDVLGTMSALGVEFLRNRFVLRASQPIEILHLWTEPEAVKSGRQMDKWRQLGFKAGRKVAVFGGQLVNGRGIEDILSAAELAAGQGLKIDFLFVGSGPLSSLINDHARTVGGNVRLLAPLPRSDYLNLLASCDIGLVATTGEHEAPAFPSKTMDYLKAGLPIVASVDHASDYGDFAQDRGFALAVDAGNPSSMVSVIKSIIDSPARANAMKIAGITTLRDVFSAQRAASQILEARAQTSITSTRSGQT